MKDYKILAEVDLNDYFPKGEITVLGTSKLKKTLESLRKDVFANDERIRVVYDYDDDYCQVLAMLQRLINEVNITNFFILILTGCGDISDRIRKISNGHDETIMTYELTDQKFTPKSSKQYDYNNSDPIAISLKKLNDKHKYLLTESKTFCMYPWVHLHAYPTGDAYPCCHAEYQAGVFGNFRKQTMKEIWSGEKMRQLRDDMLNEREHPACIRCYEQEKSGFFSGRRSANKHHGHHIKRVDDTQDDGTYNDFKMTYWDIRFSNLCNLSCRSCGHIFSSSWYQDQKELAGPEWGKKNKALFWAGRHETDMLEQLMEHIDYVEQIYFAGGEPLTMEEHYQILEELERRKKFNVRLTYNTNFTKTKLKDRYVFDYWRKFKNVSIGASLDAMGPRAEYIRRGTDWAEVEKNRQLMMEQCPNVDFYISPTLSIQNALHLPDFHREWVERGFIKAQDLNVNILQDPAWLRIDIAPEHYKEKLRTKFKEHLEWLRPLDKLNRATVGFESALNFLETDNTHLLPKFWERMTKLDDLRKENILEAIPELNELT